MAFQQSLHLTKSSPLKVIDFSDFSVVGDSVSMLRLLSFFLFTITVFAELLTCFGGCYLGVPGVVQIVKDQVHHIASENKGVGGSGPRVTKVGGNVISSLGDAANLQ